MKKNILILLVYLIISAVLFGDELSGYSIEKVQSVETGEQKGMIGWEPGMGSHFPGPTTFAVTKNKIYIPDRQNYRINVYDRDFNYLDTIIEQGKKKAHFTRKMIVDSEENIIYFSPTLGLVKIDKNGKKNIIIKPKDLPRRVRKRHNYFLINDFIFFYNDDDKIQSITAEGEILNTEQTLEELGKISGNGNTSNGGGGILFSNGDKKEPEKLFNDSENILINDRFYSTNYYKNRDYYKKIQTTLNKPASTIKGSGGGSKPKINLDDYGKNFIAYDEDHNSYWQASRDITNKHYTLSVIIMNKFGEIFEGFTFGESTDKDGEGLNADFTNYPTSGSKVSIAPNGDVYFLVGNSQKYTLYRVKHQW